MWHLLLPLGVLAHVGGLPTKANFVTPVGVANVVDTSFSITWLDGDIDPTGLFYFYFQVQNVTPTAMAKDPEFVGTVIGDGSETLIIDPANQLTWDTSAVPSGSYFVYAITDDPPLAGLYSMSEGVVTVQHPGDPQHPAVIVIEPDGEADSASSSYLFTWQASGSGPLTATVKVRRPGTEDPYLTLADDVAMTDNGDGTFSGEYEWDVADVLEGFYYAEVTVRDPGGRTHAAFSRRTMSIRHVVDAGVPDAPDADPDSPDGGMVDPPPPEDDGCCSAGGGRTSLPGALLLAVAVLVTARGTRARPRGPRRTSPRARTGPSRRRC